MENWNRLVRRTGRVEEIGARLDALTHRERLAVTRSISGVTQALLWQMAEGTTVTLGDIVPRGEPRLSQVVHFGQNSLPAFSTFEKRFCRPPAGCNDDLLYGYSEGMIRPLIGPGYFVVRETPNSPRGRVVLDSYGTPAEKPAEWPEIQSTDHGFPAVVFGYQQDFLRKVSSHVLVGRVWKFHKRTNVFYLLCRNPT